MMEVRLPNEGGGGGGLLSTAADTELVWPAMGWLISP